MSEPVKFDKERFKVGLAGFVSTRFVMAAAALVSVVALWHWGELDVQTAAVTLGVIASAYLAARTARGGAGSKVDGGTLIKDAIEEGLERLNTTKEDDGDGLAP